MNSIPRGIGEGKKSGTSGNKERGTPRAIPTYTDSAPFSSTTEVTLASTITQLYTPMPYSLVYSLTVHYRTVGSFSEKRA